MSHRMEVPKNSLFINQVISNHLMFKIPNLVNTKDEQ